MTHFDLVLPDVVGRTLSHIVVKDGDAPQEQVFLLFTDGTYYEFFADASIQGGSHVYEGTLEDVRNYMSDRRIVFEV